MNVTDADVTNGIFSFPKNVIGIRENGFKDCKTLQRIIIPKNVNNIGDSAFENCTSLESVVIQGSVTTIRSRTFYNCTNLKNIIIPDGVKEIFETAFQHCKSLQSIIIPESVSGIDQEAFAGCISLQKMTVPKKINFISSKIFSGCTSLRSITISGAVEFICDDAFLNCTNLGTIGVSNSSEEKNQNIKRLLKEPFRSMVVSNELVKKTSDMVNEQLNRILQTPVSNIMRRSAKSIGFFPEEIFTEINKQTELIDRPFYQKARWEIDKFALPLSEEEFKVYERLVKDVVDMVIMKASIGLHSPVDTSSSNVIIKPLPTCSSD